MSEDSLEPKYDQLTSIVNASYYDIPTGVLYSVGFNTFPLKDHYVYSNLFLFAICNNNAIFTEI